MAENAFEPQTFVKKVGDQTLTRRVTNPTNEVQARFDGYLPEETAPAGETETTAGTAEAPPQATVSATPRPPGGAGTRPAAAAGSSPS